MDPIVVVVNTPIPAKVTTIGIPGPQGPQGPAGPSGVTITGNWDMSGGGGASCAFPLSYAGLSGFGFLQPTISPDGQTISQALLAGSHQWAAASFSQAVPANAGTTVVRLAVGAFPAFASNGSEGGGFVKLGLYGSGPLEQAGISVADQGTGSYSWAATGAGGSVLASGTLASLPAFIDMRLRAGSSQFDVSLPNGTLLATNLAFSSMVLAPLLSIGGVGVAAGGIGRTLACGFVTGAGALSNSPYVNTGATDCCGNPIVSSQAGVPPGAAVGDVYVVTGAGTYDGFTSTVGDLAWLTATTVGGFKVTYLPPHAASEEWVAAGYVPQTRAVNGHPLSADVTLTAADVGAEPAGSGMISALIFG